MTTKTGFQDHSEQPPSMVRNLRPLLVDVAVPIGTYYLLKDAFGLSTFAALGWSSVVPALRTVWSAATERKTNGLAVLILVVNVAGLLLSLVSGDARLMLAKDSGVGSVIGIGILVSVAFGKPMMTAALKPFLVKGVAARETAWRRLRSGTAADSAAFRNKERSFSLVWGIALLGECVARVAGAYTLPVDTMVWLGTVVMIATMAATWVVSGGLAAGPMHRILLAEVRRFEGCEDAGDRGNAAKHAADGAAPTPAGTPVANRRS